MGMIGRKSGSCVRNAAHTGQPWTAVLLMAGADKTRSLIQKLGK